MDFALAFVETEWQELEKKKKKDGGAIDRIAVVLTERFVAFMR